MAPIPAANNAGACAGAYRWRHNGRHGVIRNRRNGRVDGNRAGPERRGRVRGRVHDRRDHSTFLLTRSGEDNTYGLVGILVDICPLTNERYHLHPHGEITGSPVNNLVYSGRTVRSADDTRPGRDGKDPGAD